VLGDAESGVPEHAPYDRVIVTVEAWDLPPAWTDQLAPDGRVVVPLRLRSQTRSLALDLVGDHLVSRSSEACGFVKMQGAGGHAEQGLLLAGREVRLTGFDGTGLPDPAALDLDAAARSLRAEAWSDVLVWRGEGWDTLPLWLATVYPDFCQIAVNPGHAVGRIAPVLPWGSPAAVVGPGFAYLTSRPAGEGVAELGAHAFGPDAPALAEDFADQIRIWDRDHRDGPGPEISVWPLGVPPPPADLVVPKRHTRVAVTWPRPGG
jgi:protein-L-isoaspartate(D-aspartate) O-methyltransferase